MKRSILIGMVLTLWVVILHSAEINEHNFDENAQDATIRYIEKKAVISDDLPGSVFINDSKIVLQSKVEGDIYLLNSVLTIEDGAVVQGAIYAKNSRLISDSLTLNAQWFVVSEGDTRFQTTLTDDDIPVRKPKRSPKYYVVSFFSHLIGWLLFLSLVYVVFYVARRHLFFFENDFQSYWYKYILFALPALLGFSLVLILMAVMCVTILLMPVFIAFLAYTSVSGFAFFISYLGKKIKHTPIDATISFIWGGLLFISLQMLDLFFSWIGFTAFNFLIKSIDIIIFIMSFTFGVRYLIYLIHKKRRARLLIVTSTVD